MGEMSDEAEERAWANAIDADGLLRKSIKSLQTQLASAGAERDQLANELVAMTTYCGRQREELQALQEKLALMTQDRDQLAEAVNAAAQTALCERGFSDGKAWAFREVHHWLRPFVGANPEDAAALLDAVPGLVKRLAEWEGVAI